MTDPELITMLVRDPELRAKILAEHAPDAEGRCPKCSAGGDSSGRQYAPCNLLAAALEAEERAGRARGPGG